MCDLGLECHEPSGRCFDPACDPGSENCPCAQGDCLFALMCIDGLCRPPPDSTGPSDAGDDDATDATVTTASTSGTMPATDTAIDSSDGGGDTMTTAATATDSTTGAPLLCGGCLEEHATEECSTQYANCMATMDCDAAYQCTLMNDGFDATCCPAGVEDQLAWNTLASCLLPLCMECGPVFPTCRVQ